MIDQTTTPETQLHVDYLDGYQYAGGILQFFSTAEGYVRTTPSVETTNGTPPPSYYYNYIYNYTDHLDEQMKSTAFQEVCERSSVRLSYTKDPQSGNLKILEENNYYPFGLKHSLYAAAPKMDYKKEEGQPENIPPVLNYVTNTPYNYKYQGQERQDELGLNWDSFKWRNYDYAIGRFMSIDPLADKYVYNSPYAFSENRVIDARELEGLEKVLVNKKDDKLIYNVGSSNKDKTAIHTYAHGDQTGFRDNTNIQADGKGNWVNTKSEFISVMSTGSEKEQWESRSADNPAVVVLHSCRTGRSITKDGEKTQDSAAEKFSEVENTIVVAPDERDYFSEGIFFDSEMGPYVNSNTDENAGYEKRDKKNEPVSDRTNERGEWIIYRNGEEIGRKPGNWEPNGKEVRDEYVEN